VPLVSDQFTATSGVFYFDKTSQTWSDRSHPNMRFWTKDITIDPSDATQSTWFATVFQGWGNIAMQGTGGLYRTTDRGATWSKISDEFRVNSISIHPTQRNIAYYTTETNGLWYSSNINAANPTFSQVSSYTFRHPMRVFFNPYNVKDVWITSFGNGIKRGIDNNITVLPVELAKFSGYTEGSSCDVRSGMYDVRKGVGHTCRHVLNWETATEMSTESFDIQQMMPDNSFKTIGTIKAKGKATIYTFTNEKPLADINYYRLKINDTDEKKAFSKTISLENPFILRGPLVYPNPASDVLFIENAENQDIEIVNVLGQSVMSVSKNMNHSSLTIHHLKSGVYFIKTADEMVRFIKN
jgi:Secretion system C-terminal sorting domain